jgi:hypothetical protein
VYPNQPQKDAQIRANVLQDCVLDALKSHVVGFVFDAACAVVVTLCFASAGSPI